MLFIGVIIILLLLVATIFAALVASEFIADAAAIAVLVAASGVPSLLLLPLVDVDDACFDFELTKSPSGVLPCRLNLC